MKKKWRMWRRFPWTVRHYEEKQPSIIRFIEGDGTEKGVESLLKEIMKKRKRTLRTFSKKVQKKNDWKLSISRERLDILIQEAHRSPVSTSDDLLQDTFI